MAKKKKKRCNPDWPEIIKAAQREAISRELAAEPLYRERVLDEDSVSRYIQTLKAENQELKAMIVCLQDKLTKAKEVLA